MTSKLTISVLDHDKESSTVSVRGADVNAGNFAAQEALMDAILAAVDGVSIGQVYKDERTYAVNEVTKTPPANPFSQRETKWLVRYTDDVDSNGDGSFEIPAADLALLSLNTKNMNLAAGAGLALKNALEAGMVSKLGNAITVTDVIHVGRNI